jgi:hypothetical protein
MILKNQTVSKDAGVETAIPEILLTAEGIAKKASKHQHPLTGGGFYASKFSETQAEAHLSFKKLSTNLKSINEPSIEATLQEINNCLSNFFNPKTDTKTRGEIRKRVLFLYKTVVNPASMGASTHVPTDDLFPLELIRGTRGYIEEVAEQACGSYDQGWYDASAVMCRRLLETLIIETFEAYKIEDKIKNSDGNFHYLSVLIPTLLNEGTWSIGRNAKKVLPLLKDLGDQSAHNRRYLAKKNDIDAIKRDLRIVIEELLHLSKLKK